MYKRQDLSDSIKDIAEKAFSTFLGAQRAIPTLFIRRFSSLANRFPEQALVLHKDSFVLPGFYTSLITVSGNRGTVFLLSDTNIDTCMETNKAVITHRLSLDSSTKFFESPIGWNSVHPANRTIHGSPQYSKDELVLASSIAQLDFNCLQLIVGGARWLVHKLNLVGK